MAANTLEAYRRDLTQLAAFAAAHERQVEALDRGGSRGVRPRGDGRRAVADVDRAPGRGRARVLSLPAHGRRRRAEPGRRSPRAAHALVACRDSSSLDDVDALLAAPDVTTPRGPARPRADRSAVRDGPARLRARRPAPHRRAPRARATCSASARAARSASCRSATTAAAWVRRYIAEARPALLGGADEPVAVRQRARRRQAVAPRLLEDPQGLRAPRRRARPPQSARAAAFVRDASARARRRPARDSGDARPRGPVDDADLHARARSAAPPGLRPLPSARVSAADLTAAAFVWYR